MAANQFVTDVPGEDCLFSVHDKYYKISDLLYNRREEIEKYLLLILVLNETISYMTLRTVILKENPRRMPKQNGVGTNRNGMIVLKWLWGG